MTARPTWPRSLSRPLVPEQEADVLTWNLAGDLVATLAHVRCKRCREIVASVTEHAVADEDDGALPVEIRPSGAAGFHPLGAVLRVNTFDADRPPALRREQRRDQRDDQRLALLEIPSARHLPPVLPAWCSRHGDLEIPRSALERSVATSRREGRTVAVEASPSRPSERGTVQ
ncbi:MAG: hypothetical protein M5T61_19050 [Acidimicrobiia bacterium]|nr:hypothetical protein [Acidimicrobiia bacterium]